MSIIDSIKNSLNTWNNDVFLRSEFDDFGSQRQVGRALASMQSDGELVKLGLGVYAKAKQSVLSGKPIPVKPLEILVPEALKKLGVDVNECRQMREYNSGRSTQIPTGVVFNTGNRNVQRKLGFNGKFAQYERA